MGRRNSNPSRKRLYSESRDEDRLISHDDDEPCDEGPSQRGGSQSGPTKGFSDLPEAQQDEIISRCVRFMICRNAKKRPVKRQDLSRHMFQNMENIGRKNRSFTGAFEQAQHKLRNTFGMEVVEIRKLIKSKRTTSMTAMASQSGPAAPPKGYILVSSMPKDHRVEDVDGMPLLGFLTVVAAMILLEPGCRISEQDLYASLKRIGVFVREKQGHKQLNAGNVKDLLEKHLVDQWYFEREKEDETTYYTLGPRLRAEVSDDDLLAFVEAVYKLGSDPNATLDESGRKELKARLKEAWGPDGPPANIGHEDE